jgi:2'-5' RNA ligase
MSEFRGFIAVEIPISEKLEAFHTNLEQSNERMKLVSLQNIHITLKFLGQTKTEQVTDIEKIIKNAVAELDPFSIKLQGTGVFPNRNYIKVVWIGISESSLLSSIAHKIDQQLIQLGFPREKRPFSPHITLARVKYLKDKHHLLSILDTYKDEIFSEITIDAIKLKKSTLTPTGPIYDTISKITISEGETK